MFLKSVEENTNFSKQYDRKVVHQIFANPGLSKPSFDQPDLEGYEFDSHQQENVIFTVVLQL